MMKTFFLIFITIFISNLFTNGQISERNKRNAKIAYNSAVENIIAANYSQATLFLERCIDLDPTFSEAKRALAKVKIELGSTDEALDDFKSLISENSSDAESYFYIAYLTFKGNPDSLVLKKLDQSILLGYAEPQAYYYRGLSKYLLNDFQGAVFDFTEAIEKDNKYSLAYHDRGAARRAIGDMQGALYDFRMASELNPDFPVAFNNMGSVKIILGDYKGAVQDYSVAINLDNSFAVAYNNRGAANFFLGNTSEALEDFEKSIAIDHNYYHAINNKATIFANESKYSEAIMLFNGIAEGAPNHGIAFLNRGLVKELSGDLNGACSDWKKAMELGVEDAAKYLKECE